MRGCSDFRVRGCAISSGANMAGTETHQRQQPFSQDYNELATLVGQGAYNLRSRTSTCWPLTSFSSAHCGSCNLCAKNSCHRSKQFTATLVAAVHELDQTPEPAQSEQILKGIHITRYTYLHSMALSRALLFGGNRRGRAPYNIAHAFTRVVT